MTLNARVVLSRLKRLGYKLLGRRFVHVLHINKTGGTALQHALTRPGVRPHWRYVMTLHGHAVSLRDIPVGEQVIVFVRDPISRFVSGFYSRRRQGQPRGFVPWSQDERDAFARFSTADALAMGLSSPDPDTKGRAQLAMQTVFHVRSSYADWFEDERYLRSRLPDILFLGRQESLSEDFRAIKSLLGLSDAAELPTEDVNTHCNPPDCDRALQQEALQNLTSWYKDDIRLHALCEEFYRAQSAVTASRKRGWFLCPGGAGPTDR